MSYADEDAEIAADNRIVDATDVHTFFGLTYSNYLVLHRTLLQSMPEAWQHQFVALVEQMRRAFSHVDQANSYIVAAATEATYSDLTDRDMQDLDITADPPATPGDLVDTYHDRDGREHDAHDRVMVPLAGGDPVPHYDRGRAHIEPRLS